MRLLKKLDYNSKSTEITYKISNISGLATKATLTAVENKMPIISSLVKKQIATQKLLKFKKKKKNDCHDHDKYITSPDIN